MPSANPFRAPVLSPAATGQSVASGPPPSFHSVDPIESRAQLEEELPPAYTPTPVYEQGESTVEYGPRRPYQQPQPQPQPQQIVSPSHTGMSSPLPMGAHTPSGTMMQSTRPANSNSLIGRFERMVDQLAAISTQPTGSSSYQSQSQYGPPPSRPPPERLPPSGPPSVRSPSSLRPQETGSSYLSVTPPPTHPTQPARRPTLDRPRPQSEFAQDFYAAGSESTPALPSDHSANESYTPPGGLPPSRTPTTASNRQQSNVTPDDGRPTTTPKPGHPLLHEGKMLVYPSGHSCRKCNNTGYKFEDPNHPCRKCWEKYSKPYSGALAYAPSDGSGGASSAGRYTFQKPLTKIGSSPLRRSRSHSNFPSGPPPSPGGPRQGYPGNTWHSRQPPSFLDRSTSWHRPPVMTTSVHMLPRGQQVYRAGDPRIGGRLCWRCDGRGTIMSGLVGMMLGDENQCTVCRGLGRVF